MVRTVLAIALLIGTSAILTAQKEFTYRTVATGLEIPWEIEWGPDGTLWTTERIGVMSRVDPETGMRKLILDRRDIVYLEQESGMLGFTWHPDFPDSPYVFVAYVGGIASNFWRVVERYTYVSDTLRDPVEIFRLDPAANYHQGCRLRVGPDRKLWVTMGDSPGMQGATDDSTLVGKVLRMNLDGSVPDDNPVAGELMYSKGHRNVQGFARLPNGNIWTSEHGNVTEDEVNLLQPNGNYGWPFIEGVCDDEQYEKPYCDSAGVIEPKWSSGNGTVAPCGMDYYNHDRYPVLKNSLLMTTLKYSTLYQFTLNESGTDIVAIRQHLTRSMGRIRDIAISPDGRIFLCTSNREPNGYPPYPLAEDDKIVELLPIGDSTAPSYAGPDTVFTRALPNDRRTFLTPISNPGSSSYRVDFVWDIAGDEVIYNSQWRVPFIVLPQFTYGMECTFEPTSEGTFTRVIRVVTDQVGNHDIILKGTTTVGLLKANSDTLTDGCTIGEETELVASFTNVGTDTITVDGVELTGPNAADFEIIASESGVIEPNDVVNVRLKFIASHAGIQMCTVRVQSTSYHPAQSVVICSSTSSVEETSTPYHFAVHPNPSTGDVSIVLPQGVGWGELAIHDMMGSPIWSVRTLGETQIQWDGRSTDDKVVAPGTYFISFTGSDGRSVQILQRTGH